jgi:hypothetical protein
MTTNGSGNGLSIAGPEPTKTEAEKVKDLIESVDIPAALLLAAEAVTLSKPPAGNEVLAGVYLHVEAGKGRVVATDIARCFVGSFNLPTKAEGGTPSWLRAGVVISASRLKSQVSMLAKDGVRVRLSGIKGSASLDISDVARSCVFRTEIMDGKFPDYEKRLGVNVLGEVDDDGNPIDRHWQTVGFNSVYIKSCGEIAKILDNGLAKEDRSKGGMTVRAFGGHSETSPLVFSYEGYPGSVLAIMPTSTMNVETSRETQAILGNAAKLTVAALKAHHTRQIQRESSATSEWEREDARKKAADFARRIAAIVQVMPSGEAAIAQDRPKPQPKAEPKVEVKVETRPEPEPEPEPEDERETEGATKGPTVKRTKINVRPSA